MANKGNLDKELIIKGKIRCKHCGEASLLMKWDLATINNCFTREQRRAYVSLEQKQAYTGNYIYECPKCGMGSDGKHLKVFLTD